MMETLADALPREISRVRDVVIPQYEALLGMPNVMVEPAIMMMRHALDEATKAAAAGDVVAMLEWHNELKDFTV